MHEDHLDVRHRAWEEYKNRSHYTDDQQKTFLAGMCVMWRLMTLAKEGPLFTYGPDGLPTEFGLAPQESQGPYIYKTKTAQKRHYNPKYGDERNCKCGHSYYRHFDSYEDMLPVGCKYCNCFDFES